MSVVPSGVLSPRVIPVHQVQADHGNPRAHVRVRRPHGNRGMFRDRYRPLQPRETEPIDISALRPRDWLGLLQGRVHPSWKSMTPTLQQGMQRTASTTAVIQQLLRASLETWYHAIWLPRCKRIIEQEQSQELYQGTKIRRMRAESRSGMHATPSPTPNPPPRSFPTGPERKMLTTALYPN
jgi:hypothetical protein